MQNIHLVARWLGTLEKLVEQHSLASHPEYRLFMSAEPAPTPESHIIPQGLLDNSIKITSEPPTGMRANLHGALDLFSQVPHSCLLGTALGSVCSSSPPRVPQAEHLGGVTAARDTASGASPSQHILLECPEPPSAKGLGVTRAAQGLPTQGSARLPVPFLRRNLELLQLCHEQAASAISRALGCEIQILS